MATNIAVNCEPAVQVANEISMLPSAAAVPINDDGEANFSSPSKQQSPKGGVAYASARVLDADESPSTVFVSNSVATSPVTAIALDPWSKELTASSTMADTDDAEDHQQQSLNVVVTVPSDSNDPSQEPIDFKKQRRRRRRRGRMIIAGATGFIVGAMVLGPIGAYAGALGGAAVAHGASKAGERRKDRRVARRRQQRETAAGATHVRTARASR